MTAPLRRNGYDAGRYPPTKYQRHMRVLRAVGFITDIQHDGWYFVGAGSHGGSGRTPQQAVKKCLACCNIKKYWRLPKVAVDGTFYEWGRGPMAAEAAEAIFQLILKEDL